MIYRCFTNKFVVGALTLASLLLLSMPASAQNVRWGNLVPVPVGGAATIIAGVLLLGMGIYALSRKKGRYRMIAITALTAGTLATGIGGYLMNDAYAQFLVSIQTSSGTADLMNGLNQVRNDFNAPVTITKIDPEECNILVVEEGDQKKVIDNGWPDCQVGMQLNPGMSCYINLDCNGGQLL